MPILGKYLWPPQVQDHHIYDVELGVYVPMMLQSNCTQYFWLLPCGEHLVYQGVPTAKAQHEELGHMTDCMDKDGKTCLRCKNGYMARGVAQPSHHGQRNQSYYVQVAWLALDSCLEDATLVNGTILCPTDGTMTGMWRGYCVEAKVLKGSYGAADIYVPLVNLVIQVDGQSHDHPTQQEVDMRFNHACQAQGRNLLRLHWFKELSFYHEIRKAIQLCISRQQLVAPPLMLYNVSHPLKP